MDDLFPFKANANVPGFKKAVYLGPTGQNGTFCTIHKMQDLEQNDNTFYAMKVLQKKFLRNSAVRIMFESEGRVLANLAARHKNIVNPIAFIQWHDYPVLITEFYEGINLSCIIMGQLTNTTFSSGHSTRSGIVSYRPFSEAQLLHLAIEICAGMAFIVANGFLHLDLKPHNIILADKDGGQVPKIIDFGQANVGALLTPDTPATESSLAILSTTQCSQTLTVVSGHSFVYGTPPYMAPEVFSGISHATERSDIYSMGVLLYELVTGRLPFFYSGTDALDRYQDLHQNMNIDGVPHCSPALEKIVMQCLNKKPDDRYASFLELQAQLIDAYATVAGHRYCLEQFEAFDESSVADDLQCRAMLQCNMGNFVKAHSLAEHALELNPEHVPSLFAKSCALLSWGRVPEAEIIIKEILSTDPSDVGALHLRAQAYMYRREYEQALGILFDLIGINAMDVFYHDAFECLRQLSRLGDAAQLLEHGLEDFPGNIGLKTNRGILLVLQNRLEDAELLFETHLAEDYNGLLHAWMSLIMTKTGRATEAQALLECYLNDRNNSSEYAWEALGNVKLVLNRYDEAVPCYEKALKHKFENVNDPGCAINYTRALFINNQQDRSKEFASQWLRGHDVSTHILCLWAAYYQEVELYDSALECLESALCLWPDNKEIAESKIIVLAKQNRHADALSYGYLFQEQFGSNEQMMRQCAALLSFMCMHEKALDLVQSGLRIWPDSESLAIAMVDTLLAAGKNAEADVYSSEHISGTIKSYPFRLVRAQACYATRKFDEAIHFLQEAHQVAPDDPEIASQLIAMISTAYGPREALEFANEWRERNIPSSSFLRQLGGLHLALGQYQEAIAIFHEGLLFTPDNAFLAANYYEALILEGRDEEAAGFVAERRGKYFSKALFDYCVGQVHIRAGNYNAALLCLADVFIHDTNDPILAFNALQLMRDAGADSQVIETTGHLWMEAHYPNALIVNLTAELYFANGKTEEAAALFRQALAISAGSTAVATCALESLFRISPESALTEGEIWLEKFGADCSVSDILGMIASEAKKYDQAVEYFYRAQRLYPMDPFLAAKLTKTLLVAGKLQKALHFSEQWRDDYPAIHNAHFEIESGRAFAQSGQKDKAYDCFQQALQLCGASAEVAGQSLGEMFVARPEEEVESRARKWLSTYGDDPFVWNVLGQILAAKEQYFDAVAAYDKAQEMLPDEPVLAVRKVQALRLAGRLEMALDYSRTWKEDHPANGEIELEVGQTFLMMKNKSGAVLSFRKALSLADDNPKCAAQAIEGLFVAENSDEALNEALRYLQRSLPSPEILHVLGRIHQSLRNFDTALKVFRQALDLAPNEPALQINILETLFIKGAISEARVLGEAWREKDMHETRYEFYMGLIYREQKEYDLAETSFFKAHTMLPEDSLTAALLMESLYKLNKVDKAIQFSQEWLKKYTPCRVFADIYSSIVEANLRENSA